MKMLYLLIREIAIGIKEFREKHKMFSVYVIGMALSYFTAFTLICILWYIYELVVLGHLNQNSEDTITAFKWSFLLMLPIADLYLKKINKKQ